MQVVFAGTPEFARTSLDCLREAGFAVPLVLTQPDRPAGRGLKLQPSAVKAYALEHGLRVSQPRSLRLDGKFPQDAESAREALLAARPDVIVVAAYGLLLPPWVLELPRLGCVNVHASLLPRWRGAAPIQRAIAAGDPNTGITIMQMDAGLDTGDLLLAEAIPVLPDDSAVRLTNRLASLGGRLIVDALRRLVQGALSRVPQSEAKATYAHKIEKAEATLDWAQPAEVLERRIRAFDPFPGSTAQLGAERLKCWRAEVVGAAERARLSGAATAGLPGEVLHVGTRGVVVACGRDAIRITELQRSGGRRLPVAEFLGGNPLHAGMRFTPPSS